MTLKDRINDEYFEYRCERIDAKRYARSVSYRKLLMRLHDTEFTYFIPYDDNRADDGVQLRRRFALARNDMSLVDYILGPCSVLEMMVALAVRCETIMDDTSYGDRTGQWFWGMINNLGLSSMSDSKFNKHEVDTIVNRFLKREYERNGKGGLFTVKHSKRDMRSVEIWCQLSWYLDSIT